VSLNYNYKTLILLVFIAVFISLAAFFSYVNAQLAEGVTQDQIDAALDDLSRVYGEEVTNQEQAREICNTDQYITDCAEIGKEHNLFPPEQIEQVDTILEEIKGSVAEQIKSCQNIECLVSVAEGLASRIAKKDPGLASEIDLTPKIVREKKQIVEAAKSIGLTIDQCIEMDPDTASVEVLRGCAKLAREDRVKKYIPIEARAQIDEIADSTERTIQLKEALSGGQYQCGDNTVGGCGNFCLNPGAEARAEGTIAIPAVCKQIASKFFGSQGVKELEDSYNRVSGVADYYYKKAQNFVFTTLDGQTITNPEEIGAYLEAEGRAGNVEAVSKGIDFMIAQGFATQADKDFAVKMVSKFRERGGVDFDVCVQNPNSCKDFIHDDFQNDFNVMEQVFEIMKQELGFSPDLCDQGQFDQSIGLKCLEGAKRALPKIEALASQYPEVRFIVEEIRGHIQRGDQLSQRKNEFTSGSFSGPGGCQNERGCFVYCSNPVNGPECIAFGAKQGISGFTGDQAAVKYQQYEYSLNRPAIEERYITSGESVFKPYGDPVYQLPYGQPFGSGPGYPPPFPPGSQPPYGPSPECLRAITSGDFVRAKEFCNVNVGGPQPYPYPSAPVCPAPSYYVECPVGQYRESFRNSDGCWVDGPCNPIPTYSPFPPYPYPSYSPGPGPGGSSCSKSLISLLGDGCHQMYSDPSGRQIYCDGPMSKSAKEGDTTTTPGCFYSGGPTYTPYPGSGWEGQYPGQCSDGIDNDSDGLIDLTDSSCGTVDPFVGSCPAGYHFHGEQGGFCMNDREDYSGVCYSADGKTTIKCPSQLGGQCVSPQWWDPARGYCVGSSTGGGTTSCPAGYHYHGESGGFCMNDREDYSGTCYTADGKSTTTCPKSTYTPGPYPYPSYSPGPGPGGSSCSKSLISLLGDGCHQMYSDPSGRQIYCDGPMSKSAKEGDTTTTPGCFYSGGPTYTPGPSYTPPPSCPSGQWWDYTRSACVSNTATYSPYPSYPPPTSSGSCPSGSHTMYVNNAGGYCMSDSDGSKCGSLNSSSVSSFGSCSSYQSTTTYTPPPSCPSGQWWDYTTSSCQGSATATYTPLPSCPSSQWWDYTTSSCQGSTTTYTPYPTTEYTPPPSTYSPPPESSPPPPTSGALYNHLATIHCAGIDRVWDGQYCQPEGFIARSIENTLASLAKLFGF